MRTLHFALMLIVTAGPAFSAERVLALEIATPITPITAEVVDRCLRQAREENAAAVVLRLNTPGGLMDSMRDIIQKIVASPVPVITYVTPSGGRAASAGFFLLEAGDLAAMAPGTNTGAAHPVAASGEMDSVMKQKVENDAAASLRSLVSRRGRNSDLAQQAVMQSHSFTEKEALDGHLIELIAASEAALLKDANGRSVKRFDGSARVLHLDSPTVDQFQLSTRQRILTFLSDPNLAFILLLLGALGLYAEFHAPGLIFPGVAGAICMLVSLAALSFLPINSLGALLLALGLLFFGLELKFASHGVLSAGGVISLTLGALLLVDAAPELRIHLSTALGAALPFGLITAFLVTLAARARANKSLIGPETMPGELGVAVETLNPAGRILLRGEYWNAVSTEPLEAGAKVRVLHMNGLEASVEPVRDRIVIA